MALEDLIHSVEVIAQERSQEILERAHRESEEIIKEAKLKEDEIKRRRIETAKRDAEIERIKLLSAAKEENKMRIIRIKDELLQKTFQGALSRLESLRETPRYEAILRVLMKEALEEFEGKEATLHVDVRDLPLCRKILGELHRNSEIVADLKCAGGLNATLADGSFTVFNTFESRLVKVRDLMRSEIFLTLFGE